MNLVEFKGKRKWLFPYSLYCSSYIHTFCIVAAIIFIIPSVSVTGSSSRLVLDTSILPRDMVASHSSYRHAQQSMTTNSLDQLVQCPHFKTKLDTCRQALLICTT